MRKKVVIVGKAASGKDYLKEYFESCGLLVCVADTTRPMREGEESGKEYNFIDKYTFLSRKFNRKYIESGYFNTWYYGTPKREWYEKDVFIMTPSAIGALSKSDRGSCTVVYLDIPQETLIERLEMREDSDSVERRVVADSSDFLDFKDYDIRVSNPKFCAKSLLDYILNPSKSKRNWLRVRDSISRIKNLKF